MSAAMVGHLLQAGTHQSCSAGDAWSFSCQSCRLEKQIVHVRRGQNGDGSEDARGHTGIGDGGEHGRRAEDME
jgi:hypothetical protein